MNKSATISVSLKAPITLANRNEEDGNLPYYRSEFMRDRDRLLYSKAFRRLAGKTQVYLAHSNDHLRTRLTHTLEVAQIAKTISSALGLDINLTEAIAYGHDIGHAPFGHAGEQMLHELMTPQVSLNNGKKSYMVRNAPFSEVKQPDLVKKSSGFKHNWQSLRIAVNLENVYEMSGLNLTNYTLYGMLNHCELNYNDKIINNRILNFYSYLEPTIQYKNQNAWSFEAYVVAQADEIAQRHHDLEDAIRGNLISASDIIALLDPLCRYMSDEHRANFKVLKDAENQADYFIAILSKIVVDLLVSKLVNTSTINLNSLINSAHITNDNITSWYTNADEKVTKNIISFDMDGDFTKGLKVFTDEVSTRTISSCQIQRMDSKGQYIIRKLFDAFYTNPQQLPDKSIVSYFRYVNEYSDKKQIDNIRNEKGIGYIRRQFIDIFKDSTNEKEKLMLMRVICDHISGMTDNFAIDTYSKFYGSRNDIII